MAWTTPKTNWATGELVTAEDMNTFGENLTALKQPPTAVYTTTADMNVPLFREFAEVVDANLRLMITTQGGDVSVHFSCEMARTGSYDSEAFIDLEVNGVRQGDANGIIRQRVGASGFTVSFTRLIQNLSPGSHTFKLLWKRGGNGFKIRAGAHFWAREI